MDGSAWGLRTSLLTAALRLPLGSTTCCTVFPGGGRTQGGGLHVRKQAQGTWGGRSRIPGGQGVASKECTDSGQVGPPCSGGLLWGGGLERARAGPPKAQSPEPGLRLPEPRPPCSSRSLTHPQVLSPLPSHRSPQAFSTPEAQSCQACGQSLLAGLSRRLPILGAAPHARDNPQSPTWRLHQAS